jgi:hypothetical protein
MAKITLKSRLMAVYLFFLGIVQVNCQEIGTIEFIAPELGSLIKKKPK